MRPLAETRVFCFFRRVQKSQAKESSSDDLQGFEHQLEWREGRKKRDGIGLKVRTNSSLLS